MHRILVTAAAMLCLSARAAVAGPTLKVYIALKGDVLRRSSDIKHIVLANVSDKPVEVATAGMSATVRETGDAATLILSFWRPELWKGHRMVTSRLSLVPTVLKPNQAVVCHLPVEEIAKTLDVLLGAAKELRVMYRVSDEAGKQFDVWSGAVRSDAYPVGKK